MKYLAKKVVELRGEISQTALAKKAGIPQSAISEIEAGKRIPRIDTLQKLATALGVTVVELLEDELPDKVPDKAV